MDELKRYNIVYTDPAAEDMLSKAEYIAQVFADSALALRWYQRLDEDISDKLSSLPYKYPLLDRGQWQGRGVRLFSSRNDLVLYTVDEDSSTVFIRSVYTRGKDLSQ